MHDATGNQIRDQFATEREDGGFAMWLVIYAVLMVTAMTFFAGANLIGDRFDRTAVTVWDDPA